MQILDVEGYCPSCGERKLHRMPGGMIQCLNPQCTDQGAAQKLLMVRKVSDLSGDELMAAIREETGSGQKVIIYGDLRTYQLTPASTVGSLEETIRVGWGEPGTRHGLFLNGVHLGVHDPLPCGDIELVWRPVVIH